MQQSVYFTLAAVILYIVADRILDRIEVSRGRRFEHRNLIFFVILATLALSSFTIIQHLLATS